jgi:hypothetical protein
MSIDPDFIVTINGESVTKYTSAWKFTDSEKKSTLEVTIMNPDQKFSGKFDTGQDVELIFGYVGNTGDKVKMEIYKVEEAYSVNEGSDYIKVTGQDALSAMEGKTLQGGGNTPIKEPKD